MQRSPRLVNSPVSNRLHPQLTQIHRLPLGTLIPSNAKATLPAPAGQKSLRSIVLRAHSHPAYELGQSNDASQPDRSKPPIDRETVGANLRLPLPNSDFSTLYLGLRRLSSLCYTQFDAIQPQSSSERSSNYDSRVSLW